MGSDQATNQRAGLVDSDWNSEGQQAVVRPTETLNNRQLCGPGDAPKIIDFSKTFFSLQQAKCFMFWFDEC